MVKFFKELWLIILKFKSSSSIKIKNHTSQHSNQQQPNTETQFWDELAIVTHQWWRNGLERERERGPAVREEEINWLPLLTHATSFHYDVKVRDVKYFNSSFYKELPLFILVMHLLIPIFISSRKPSNKNFIIINYLEKVKETESLKINKNLFHSLRTWLKWQRRGWCWGRS